MRLPGFVLSRDDYVRFECGGVEPTYPRSTSEAVAELQARGGAIDENLLNQYVCRGRIAPGVSPNGRSRLYTAEQIDALLGALADRMAVSPLSIALTVLRVSAHQFWKTATEAFEQLRSEYGELAGNRFDPKAFCLHVEPRDPGESKLTMSPSPATLARLKRILERDRETADV